MVQIQDPFWKDANFNPITNYGITTAKSLTLVANNATLAAPLFSITGSVLVKALYGIVTTTLGTNLTAAYWRLNDQTAQVNISLNTGTTISGLSVGSLLNRSSVAGIALTADNSSAGKVRDPVAATAPDAFMPFVAVQKVGGVETDIEFVYSTTETPTSGVIKFYADWLPLTETSRLVAL